MLTLDFLDDGERCAIVADSGGRGAVGFFVVGLVDGGGFGCRVSWICSNPLIIMIIIIIIIFIFCWHGLCLLYPLSSTL